MEKYDEYTSIIRIDDYKIEVVRENNRFDKVSLWLMRPGTNLKMRFADMRLNPDEETMARWLDELISKNFEMKKFDYECLMSEAFAAGLVDAR